MGDLKSNQFRKTSDLGHFLGDNHDPIDVPSSYLYKLNERQKLIMNLSYVTAKSQKMPCPPPCGVDVFDAKTRSHKGDRNAAREWPSYRRIHNLSIALFLLDADHRVTPHR